jgi:hypothetical protein
MRTANRRATRDRLAKRNSGVRRGGADLADGTGTITGGPMEPIDLMEILNRGAECVSRGGAVSGAAHVEFISPGKYDGGPDSAVGQSRAIALSDGSRISFASVGDPGALKQEDAGSLADA